MKFQYNTTGSGERRKFKHLWFKIWYFYLEIFQMRRKIKIEIGFNNWEKK